MIWFLSKKQNKTLKWPSHKFLKSKSTPTLSLNNTKSIICKYCLFVVFKFHYQTAFRTRCDVTKLCSNLCVLNSDLTLPSPADNCENDLLASNCVRWKEFYLKGKVYKAERPPPIWGCSGELGAHARKHRHHSQLQTALLQVPFKEHAGIPLQHLKGHLPHLYQQLLVVTGPFLRGERTQKFWCWS